MGCPVRWFRRRLARSRSERGPRGAAHRAVALAGGLGPAPTRPKTDCRLSSRRAGSRPEEPGELARDRDGRDVVRLAALAQATVETEQPLLGAPGDLQHV